MAEGVEAWATGWTRVAFTGCKDEPVPEPVREAAAAAQLGSLRAPSSP
jgi:hypothetical protein